MTSIAVEPIQTELLTFAAEGINKVAEQLKTIEYPLQHPEGSIPTMSRSEDRFVWMQDQASFLQEYARGIQAYASNLQQLIEEYVNVSIIQRSYEQSLV